MCIYQATIILRLRGVTFVLTTYESTVIFNCLKTATPLPTLANEDIVQRNNYVSFRCGGVSVEFLANLVIMQCSIHVRFRCCGVAMALFVFPDTPYVQRIKCCHDMPMAYFFIHSGSPYHFGHCSSPHIRHANAIDMMQKRHAYTSYFAGL